MPSSSLAPSSDRARAILQSIGLALLVVLLIAVFVAIGYRTRRPASRRVPVSMMPSAPVAELAPAARVALDGGNAAYRAKHFGDALAQYRAAAAAAPGEAAPYFGIYMAATALHRTAVADSALVMIRAHSSSGGQMLSDSALQQLHSGAVPPTHPGFVHPGAKPQA